VTRNLLDLKAHLTDIKRPVTAEVLDQVVEDIPTRRGDSEVATVAFFDLSPREDVREGKPNTVVRSVNIRVLPFFFKSSPDSTSQFVVIGGVVRRVCDGIERQFETHLLPNPS
jgi:hypothetical protein